MVAERIEYPAEPPAMATADRDDLLRAGRYRALANSIGVFHD